MRLRQICDFTMAYSTAGNDALVDAEPSAGGNHHASASGSNGGSSSSSSSSSSTIDETIDTGCMLSPSVVYSIVIVTHILLNLSVLFLANPSTPTSTPTSFVGLSPPPPPLPPPPPPPPPSRRRGSAPPPRLGQAARAGRAPHLDTTAAARGEGGGGVQLHHLPGRGRNDRAVPTAHQVSEFTSPYHP